MKLSEEEHQRIAALTVEEFDKELQAEGYYATVRHRPDLQEPHVPWEIAYEPESGSKAYAIFSSRLKANGVDAPREFLLYLAESLRIYQGA